MNGYLYVQPVSEIEREIGQRQRQNYGPSDLLLDMNSSLEGLGWIPLAAAIKEGNHLKVSAERHGTHYEARFDMGSIAPEGENGTCEIRGGPLACVGTFVNVSATASSQFKLSFVCHSSSGDGKSILEWRILVNEFVDADNLPTVD
jgi:hypothetical protein